MHTRTIHILQSTYEDLSNTFRGTSGHSAFSQVSPNYFRHMLYSAAGSTPSAPSNPGRGRINTLHKRMGRSFQSPQDRSGDQEESGRSCQSSRENIQKNLHACNPKQCGSEALKKYHHSFCCDYPLRLNFQDMKIHAKEVIINQQVYCCGKSS